MTDQIKDQKVNDEQTTSKKYKIFGEAKGCYTLVEDNKIFHFLFPAHITLAENYDKISIIKEEIWKAMEKQKKAEEEKESKSKIITP